MKDTIQSKKFTDMILTIIITFILGYTLIALERQIGVSKTAIALILGITLWVFALFQTKLDVNTQIIEHLGNTAEILFYLLGAMTIVEWVDTHEGFNLITKHITTRNKRKLLWLIAFITFIMSSVLDNLTTAIVMIMLLRQLVTNQQERWIFGSIIIIAANAGGAWTPIGDVTTIMLWIHNNITSMNVIRHLFLPSLVSLLIPVGIATFWLKGEIQDQSASIRSNLPGLSHKVHITILALGIGSLIFVPVFKELTNLPPFMGIMFALGCVWIYTEMLYNRKKNITRENTHRIPSILSKVDYSTLLFFLGILMAVAALQVVGILDQMATFLNDRIHNVYFINTIIGFLSSVIDNVPLVAAAMGMYPLTHADGTHLSAYMMNFTTDGTFWELLAYCAGIGGSILIIGSAAGVVVMGMEKINFTWYLKHITWIATLGYLAGIGIYYIVESL